MPDEYTRFGQVSEKTDAFAFGMVLAELLLGQRPAQVVELVCYDQHFFKYACGAATCHENESNEHNCQHNQ